MKSPINNKLLSSLSIKEKPYDIWDTKVTGFILRVYPTGKMVYRCEYARGKRITMGRADILSPAQAREQAKAILGDAAKGIDPKSKPKKNNTLTLEAFLYAEYAPWLETNRKRGKDSFKRIKYHFLPFLGKKALNEINPKHLEQWCTKRLKDKIKPTTINRDVAILKALLSKAVEWLHISEHPLKKLKALRVDTSTRARYLRKNEAIALRAALDARELKMKQTRDSANRWRTKRNYDTFASLSDQTFADHLKPMVLISLNTGIRRGALLQLTWHDICFSKAILTIPGNISKSNKTRHIPLNKEALSTLQAWYEQSSKTGLVFKHQGTNKQLYSIQTSWAGILKVAQLKDFRWHDLRHDFASQLAIRGVDLNTIRELLGHSDIKMTLRYAHLAPEHKADAVAKLLEG